MKYSSPCQLLFLLLTVTLVTGCAHKNLIHAANDFEQQGRYELAIDKYQEALALEPNDKAVRQKLDAAQQALDQWLDGIKQQATIAEQNGLHGRALLLYSKVAQRRKDPQALAQYKRLYQQLSEQARYQIAIDAPPTLGKNIGQSLADIQVISHPDGRQNNQFSVQASYQAPVFKTKAIQRNEVQSYVAGTETIANPDFLHLQQHIAELRNHLQMQMVDNNQQRKTINDAQQTLTALRKDREIAQLRLASAAANSADARHWQQELTRLDQAVLKADQQLESEQERLDVVAHTLAVDENKLSAWLNDLSLLSPTAEQDVYQDYTYPVKEITRIASGQLTVTFSDGVKKIMTVTASTSDKGHDAHPIIELAHDPIKLLSDPQLTDAYQVNVGQQLEKTIEQQAKAYRDRLSQQANQQVGIDQKLEAWVHYGLASRQGVDSETLLQIKRQLEQEFGVTGEFPVNQLLHLF